MPRTTIAVAVAAVAVAAAAAGCLHDGDEPSAKLQALEADPMATYEPPDAELVDTESQSEGETTLGKPQGARYTRLFALQGDGEQAFDDAVAAARSAGWTFEEEPSTDAFGGTVGLATRTLSTGTARLSISLLVDEQVVREGVDPPALRISLEHV
jgi:hypothetical protein